MSDLPLKAYQEDRQERGIYDQRNTLNNFTGKEWLFSTKTIIPKIYDDETLSSFVNDNLDILPVPLRRELIETFSKPGEFILDPFTGSELTIIAGHSSNLTSSDSDRTIIGIISKEPSLAFKGLLEKLNIDSSDSLFRSIICQQTLPRSVTSKTLI